MKIICNTHHNQKHYMKLFLLLILLMIITVCTKAQTKPMQVQMPALFSTYSDTSSDWYFGSFITVDSIGRFHTYTPQKRSEDTLCVPTTVNFIKIGDKVYKIIRSVQLVEDDVNPSLPILRIDTTTLGVPYIIKTK